MTKVNERSLIAWLAGAFPVKSIQEHEANFPCPFCYHPSFYFNVRKKVGWCHRAQCHRRTTYTDLLEIVGYAPEEAGYVPRFDNQKQVSPAQVGLPMGVWPVLAGEESDSWVVDVLKHRGVTEKKIKQFNIHAHNHWVYVPVYEDSKLIQYVGRRLNRKAETKEGFSKEEPRYDYLKGIDITQYLFGWEEAKTWKTLTLVENTFNSIWLREELNCTTPFGSYLSPIQITKIAKSKAKHIAILFDEGANKSAQKAATKLNNIGIAADFIKIKKQPDDYTKKHLKEIIDATRPTNI